MWAIENTGQGCQDGFVLVGIGSELGNRLSYQDIEPVQRLRLVGIDIVVGLGEYYGSRQAGRMSQNVGWREPHIGSAYDGR